MNKTDPILTDFHPSLAITDDGIPVMVKNEDCIFQNIKNLLGSVVGERVRNPVGTRLFGLLFEPINQSTASAIRDIIVDAIERFDDRVTIRGIRVIANEDNNTFDVTITVSIVNIDRISTFETRLQSLRNI